MLTSRAAEFSKLSNVERALGDGERRVSIRPLGGAAGCLMMILFSVLASILLTVLLNLITR